MSVRVLEIAFGEDLGPFTLVQLMERLKRYEQVAIARPLDDSFKCALRIVIKSEMKAKDEVGRVCEALGVGLGVHLAWNDSAERH